MVIWAQGKTVLGYIMGIAGLAVRFAVGMFY